MRTLRTERVALVPVDGGNARDLWEVLNGPDLRRYQDIPRIRAEEFERQVRARPKELRARRDRAVRVAAARRRPGGADGLDLPARERPLAAHR